jgi:DME family drug/metabolite transporter
VSPHARGSLVIAVLAGSWGIIGILVREVPLGAFAIVFFRVSLAAVAIAAALMIAGRGELLRPPGRAALALGVVLAAHWSAYFAAIKHTSVASAVLITYAGPALIALLARAILDERVPRRSLVALAVSLAGVAVVSLQRGGDAPVRAIGVALAVLAAGSYALLIVLAKRIAAHEEPVSMALWQYVVASVLLAPAALVADYGAVGSADLAYLALLGVLLTGLSGVLYLGALRSVPATTAGILAYMEPVSAAVLAALLLGESLSLQTIAGGLAIVAAGVAVALRSPVQAPAVAAHESP